MGHRVQRIKTSVSEPEMVQAIIAGWRDLFGNIPTKEQIALLMAQNDLETGHRNAMWNYNVGNITTNGNGLYNFFDDLTTEEQISPGSWNKMNLKYRAYDNLEDGVKDYLKLLSSNHYSQAWQHILHPDPVAFSKSLKSGGYYTADEDKYTKLLSSLYNRNQKSSSYDNVMANKNTPSGNEFANIEGVIDNFLKSLFANKSLKQIYKQALPNHDIIIKIKSPDYVSGMEFSRVLCNALEEELLVTAYPHSDGQEIEIECMISGPMQECFNAVQQMSIVLAETFQEATKKIGAIQISTECFINKRSSFYPVSFRTASTTHREFLLKFAQKDINGHRTRNT
jgi:hypothetical protein